MEVQLPTPGGYVIAVSGGVDSMTLLHLLQQEAAADRSWKLTVVHLDHGTRQDSADDRRLVQNVAEQYGLPFVYREAGLGAGASEAKARKARYKFLHQVRQASGAQAIITAHHQDDVLETAIMNLLRGTGRKGLTSLASQHDVKRPLLHLTKRDIIAYATEQGLAWHEDTSNQNEAYTRNYVRHRLLNRFDDAARLRLWLLITKLQKTNHELDSLLTTQLHLQDQAGTLDRRWFNQLPHAVAREVLAAWLRAHGLRDFDRRSLERLVIAAKVAPSGRTFPIRAGRNLQVGSKNLALNVPER